MKKTFTLLFCLYFIMSGVSAQSPKRELRATWIASVSRIDWPKSTNSNTQKQELIAILDKLEMANMNTAYLQVRPMCDAFYKSKYEPWSQYLTGTRGKDPGYDPLAFAIEEAHKRGIELHAWLNPYRYESGAANHGADDYVRKNHPEWLLKYANLTILDPSNPEVNQYIINVVEDIISNYNVDGVIFDDYFYPYEGTTNQDAYSQNLYKPVEKNVGDWRRENVNKTMADIYKMIQQTKSTVKFGIGPFGIWGGTPTLAAQYGVDYINTSGGTSAYDKIYCDALAWMKEKSIDYISPQCYWPSSNTAQWGYSTLVPWWSKVAKKYDRHFYSSMRISTMGTATRNSAEMKLVYAEYNITAEDLDGFSQLERAITSTKAKSTDECGYEVDLNRSTDMLNAPGHVFFNTTQFFSYGLHSYLKNEKFTQPALTPLLTWKTAKPFPLMSDVKLEGNTFSWSVETLTTDRFAIYLVPNAEAENPEAYKTSAYLKKITWNKSLDMSQYMTLMATHKLAVSIVDAHGNESNPVSATTGMDENTIDNIKITGGVQSIIVVATQPMGLEIYSVTGQLVKRYTVEEGESIIPITPGIYIANKQKIIVR